MDNVHEFKPEDWKGWNIRRAKGLGTLQKQERKVLFMKLKQRTRRFF
jgi:DNA gyrase/topoisomerase IV subunit B